MVAEVIHQHFDYDKNRLVELMIEEYRLPPLEIGGLVKELYAKNLSISEQVQLLLEFVDENDIQRILNEKFDLNKTEFDKITLDLLGTISDPITFNARVSKIRANDFGNEYRSYLWLNNIGNGRAGWGYLIPDNLTSETMMDSALKAKISQSEIYIYGKIDDDGKKIKILELGLA